MPAETDALVATAIRCGVFYTSFLNVFHVAQHGVSFLVATKRIWEMYTRYLARVQTQ